MPFPAERLKEELKKYPNAKGRFGELKSTSLAHSYFQFGTFQLAG